VVIFGKCSNSKNLYLRQRVKDVIGIGIGAQFLDQVAVRSLKEIQKMKYVVSSCSYSLKSLFSENALVPVYRRTMLS